MSDLELREDLPEIVEDKNKFFLVLFGEVLGVFSTRDEAEIRQRVEAARSKYARGDLVTRILKLESAVARLEKRLGLSEPDPVPEMPGRITPRPPRDAVEIQASKRLPSGATPCGAIWGTPDLQIKCTRESHAFSSKPDDDHVSTRVDGAVTGRWPSE